jgi:hypothetical protein
VDDTKAKYHHLIPQTYMSAWANQSGTLNVEFLSELGTIVPRNKEKIAGITDYHSIKVGMPFCTQADTDKLFSILSDYNVEINGNLVFDTLEMNKHFFDFDNWIITRKDGTLVSKKSLKREIEKIKIKDIETNWCTKYENHWGSFVEEVENKILNTTDEYIPSFNKSYLINFYVALNWRGFQSNKQFEEIFELLTKDLFKQINIPFEERELPCLETAADEIRHELLLKFYRLFLEDKGVIYKHAKAGLKHTSFHFLIADGPTYFDTCDSPSFVFKRGDGTYQGVMPITPQILLAQGKCTDKSDVYGVTHITDGAVKKYNAIIKQNATEFVIHA